VYNTALSDDGVDETSGRDVESRIECFNANGSCLSDNMVSSPDEKQKQIG
jgi:hypothetical protein